MSDENKQTMPKVSTDVPDWETLKEKIWTEFHTFLDDIKKQSIPISKIDNISGDTNPYLEKEQKKFYASQWKEQLYLQIICGMQKDITIGSTTYHNKTLSDEDESAIQKHWLLLQKVTQLHEVQFSLLGQEASEGKPIDMDRLRVGIEELEKRLTKIENDYFVECAFRFYEIPKDEALKNKELLSPYVAGRNYLKDLRVVGNTYNQIKNDTLTPSLLKKLVNMITERHYS